MDNNDSARRVLGGLSREAKKMKRDRLMAKFAPQEGSAAEEAAETPAQEAAESDGMNAAVDATSLPSVDDVKAKLAGQGAMDALKAQGDANAELGDQTLDENKAALQGLDEDRLKQLVASLRG